jgi:hypothetical protein
MWGVTWIRAGNPTIVAVVVAVLESPLLSVTVSETVKVPAAL